jgi:hypothetical protein
MLLGAGFLVFTYHLFRANYRGVDQADFHLNTIHKLVEAQGKTTPIFGDVETSDGVSNIKRRYEYAEFRRPLRAADRRTGTYSSKEYWRVLMDNEEQPDDEIDWAAAWNPYDDFVWPIGWQPPIEMRQWGVATKYNWCPAVPGINGAVDVNYFYGTREELYALCGASPPPGPEPEDEMSKAEILARIDAMKVDLAEDVAELDVLRAEVVELPEGSTPPAPVPTTRNFHITVDKSVANFFKRTNAKGKPIMIIYPEPDAPAKDRIIYGQLGESNVNSGNIAVVTYDPPMAADGSNPGPWLKIANKRGKNGETLYINYKHGTF